MKFKIKYYSTLGGLVYIYNRDVMRMLADVGASDNPGRAAVQTIGQIMNDLEKAESDEIKENT